jgi:hypothetical protein
MSGQLGCFACTGSPGGLCSATEELLVDHDPGCYACLLRTGCLDNAPSGMSGNECEDLMGNAAAGPNAGAWKPSLCRMTVDCILQSACANPSVANCYCGTADMTACLAPNGAHGPCLVAENGGLETTDARTALGASFTSKSLAAGMANAIFTCAAQNGCSTCLGSPVPDASAATGVEAGPPEPSGETGADASAADAFAD